MSVLRTSSRLARLRASAEIRKEEEDQMEIDPTPQASSQDLKVFARSIPDQKTWDKLAHVTSDSAFKNLMCVKVVYRVETKELHLINTRRYPLHHEFVKRVLKDKMALEKFNVVAYEDDDRPYILGSLTHYGDQEKYVFEQWPGDTLNVNGLLFIFKLLKNAVFFGDELLYRPSSAFQEDIASRIGNTVLPTITSDALFKGIKYQPLTMGTSYGELHIFTGPASKYDLDIIKSNWIVLFEEVPIDLPAVAGLVTSALQTPLSHVALLCQNRKTPNMALKDSHKDPALLSLQGKVVMMSVRQKGFKLHKAKDPLAALSWMEDKLSARISKKVHLKASLDPIGVKSLLEFREERRVAQAVNYVGSKAATLCEIYEMGLASISEVPFKYALTIPFHFYHEHVERSCKQYFSDLENPQDDAALCKSLRTAITAASISSKSHLIGSLLKGFKLWEQSGVLGAADGIIFRSSTNVEDIPGFNGAGLYLSEALPLSKCFDKDAIADVVRRVWASVWETRGFVERKLFGIVQKEVQAAILVQPWFSRKVLANGVGVTANPFRKDFPAHFLNVSCAGKLVTDGSGGATPEQILVYDEGTPVPEVVSRSSETGGKPLLVKQDIGNLFDALMALHNYYIHSPKKKPQANCVDVEFLVMDTNERDILLLQCRPLNLVR